MKDFVLPSILDGESKHCELLNCVRNRYKHLKKWAKRAQTNCFRIYDRDIAKYPLAIDLYDNRFCIHYFSKTSDSEADSKKIIEHVNDMLKQLFGASATSIYWRTRQKTKTTRQYEKNDEQKEFFDVIEHGVKFKVNLTDYVDTGLFLDHRETRQTVASLAKGKTVLNLFAYTCAFSVHTALAGAIFTKSVDMSNTYTNWGRKNFLLNNLPSDQHEIVRADCLKFLDSEIASKKVYDIIVIDPPTMSRSKKMDQLFTVQGDYIALINKSFRILKKEGIIFFSTNSRKFIFDPSHFKNCQILEISNQTLPPDFQDKKIHRCWKIINLKD